MKSCRILVPFWVSVAALSLPSAPRAAAQEMPPPASAPPQQAAQQTAPGASQTLRLTLDDALARARKNSTQFQSAQTDAAIARQRSEEHTSELQSHLNLVCRLLLEKKKKKEEISCVIRSSWSLAVAA